MRSIITDIESEIENLLFSRLGDEMEIRVVDFNDPADALGFAADHNFRQSEFPHVLINAGFAEQVGSITTQEGPQFRFTVTMFIFYHELTQNQTLRQKRVTEDAALKTLAVIAGERVGSDITSQEPLSDFTLEKVLDIPEGTLFSVEGATDLQVSLRELEQTI